MLAPKEELKVAELLRCCPLPFPLMLGVPPPLTVPDLLLQKESELLFVLMLSLLCCVWVFPVGWI